MNAPKPTESLVGQLCPLCRKGHFALSQINHTEALPDGNLIALRDIWVDRCDSCGEVVFPAETTQFIETIVAEETEQLTPQELERIREDFGTDQTETGEILGLGSKTFHRWESGHQFPTRSMSFYIRVIAEFPQAFEWLRQRAWRNKNRIATSGLAKDWTAMFPDLVASPTVTDRFNLSPLSASRRNPALGLCRAAFITK